MKDMQKYRDFPGFLYGHKEIFNGLPELGALAAREMLTVNGVSKKQKQKIIMGEVRKQTSLLRLAKMAWSGWRCVK